MSYYILITSLICPYYILITSKEAERNQRRVVWVSDVGFEYAFSKKSPDCFL